MQNTRQHMALVDDEYGSVVGVITMENIIEQIVGSVQDEFDSELPDIVPEGLNVFNVRGQLPIERVNRELGLDLYASDVDTLSGLLVSRMNRLLKVGDRIRLRDAVAEVTEEEDGRATRVRIRISEGKGNGSEETPPEQGGDDGLVGVVLNWATRRVLSWRLSNTLDARFCAEALERYSRPRIFLHLDYARGTAW